MVKKVLLVEDDPDDRDLFTDFFKSRSDVDLLTPVGNGLELIEFLHTLKTDKHLPDLIVLDQNMPKMNGKQTLTYLKSSERFSHIPTVVYSTYAETTLVLECKKLGARMVAEKPIDENGYRKMMDDFLKVLS